MEFTLLPATDNNSFGSIGDIIKSDRRVLELILETWPGQLLFNAEVLSNSCCFWRRRANYSRRVRRVLTKWAGQVSLDVTSRRKLLLSRFATLFDRQK